MATKNKSTTSGATTGRAEANRKTKLLKLLKQQPNNEQIKDALANIKYRRKKPKSREWSKTEIRLAQLFKLFTGRADWDLFSSNPTAQAAAIAAHSKKPFNNLSDAKVSFKLGARAHDKYGKLVWA